MVKMKHKAFMQKTNLQISDFTGPVQKKVSIFDTMQSKLKETIGEDHTELTGKLFELDQEICSDMFDEMQDRLENNDVIESPSDEAILEQLWKMKKTKGLRRSDLKKYGIKIKIKGWEMRIGKFILHRTKAFSYIYDLEKISTQK